MTGRKRYSGFIILVRSSADPGFQQPGKLAIGVRTFLCGSTFLAMPIRTEKVQECPCDWRRRLHYMEEEDDEQAVVYWKMPVAAAGCARGSPELEWPDG